MKKVLSLLLATIMIFSTISISMVSASAVAVPQASASQAEFVPKNDFALTFSRTFRNFINHFTEILMMKPHFATDVEMEQDKLEVTVNETKALKAAVLPKNCSNTNLKWYSENSSVASVNQNGYVTGKKAGQVKIYAVAEDGGFYDVCNVHIVNAPVTENEKVECTRVTISFKDELLLMKDSSRDIYYSLAPSNTTEKVVVEKEDESGTINVSVDKNTKKITIKGVKKGFSCITVTCGKASAKLYINVVDPEINGEEAWEYVDETKAVIFHHDKAIDNFYKTQYYDHGELVDKVTFMNGVTHIPENFIYENFGPSITAGIKEVVVMNTVEYIGSGAFKNMFGLLSAQIYAEDCVFGSNLFEIDEELYNFENTDMIKPKDNSFDEMYKWASSFDSFYMLTIGEGVDLSKAEPDAFSSGVYGVPFRIIRISTDYIPAEMFRNCYVLKGLQIDTEISSIDGAYIGDKAFSNCISLEEVQIKLKKPVRDELPEIEFGKDVFSLDGISGALNHNLRISGRVEYGPLPAVNMDSYTLDYNIAYPSEINVNIYTIPTFPSSDPNEFIKPVIDKSFTILSYDNIYFTYGPFIV